MCCLMLRWRKSRVELIFGLNRMKMRDDTKMEKSTRTLLKECLKLVRECEDSDLDFEKFVDKENLMIVREQLKCCLDHYEILKKKG